MNRNAVGGNNFGRSASARTTLKAESSSCGTVTVEADDSGDDRDDSGGGGGGTELPGGVSPTVALGGLAFFLILLVVLSR